MRRQSKIFWVALIVLSAGFAFAQNRLQLKNRLERNREQIELTKEVLRDNRDQQIVTLKTLQTYEKQIELREKALESMNVQINRLDVDIEEAREEISGITREIARIKKEFSEAIVAGYKNSRKVSRLHFVFSSNSFNELIRKINYLERIMEYRRLQLDLIEAKKQENSVKINRLEMKRAEALSLRSEREEEAEMLKEDQLAYADLVDELKTREQQLLQEIARREQLADRLEEQIRQEIKRERERTARAAEKKKDDVLSNGFKPGTLPWPAEGYVSERFGRHKHHDLKNITTENNGINVVCKDGARVKAVYDGTVSAVLKVPGLKTSVLVKHGGYFTVYANLEFADCSSGQEVMSGQELGTVGKNQDGVTELHFEVWKGTNKLNPENWLLRR